MYDPKYAYVRFDDRSARRYHGGPPGAAWCQLGRAAPVQTPAPVVDGVELETGKACDMMVLTPVSLRSVAVIGARCADIATGAGATLIEIARDKPDLVVHALILTGGGTDLEVAEKNAFAALCPSADVRLTVADLPAGELSGYQTRVSALLADFRRDCEPDMVFGPQGGDHDRDRRLLAGLIPPAFQDRPLLGYDILAWKSDLPSTPLYLPIPTETAHEKARLLTQCYSPVPESRWCDDEAVLSLMRVRGVQCRARYAEAFTVEQSASEFRSDYSVN